MTRRRLVQLSGAGLAAVFAAVGVVFLVIPGDVLGVFNWVARRAGWPETTTCAFTLFLALAVAYMYVVTLLALQMARHPEERVYPWVLAQGKAASALVCLLLFVLQARYAIYLANFLVDGGIALFVWWLCLSRGAGEQLRSPR